jgi:hypothetical protein
MFELLHYKPKKISEIKSSDLRVAIIGKIMEKKENSFVVDDGSGKVEVLFDGEVRNNELIRAFCSVIDDKLKADIVQNLNGFDLDLFNKINELYRKFLGNSG